MASLCVPHSLTHSLSHSPLLSLYPSDRQVTCDPPGEAALWVKHTEFGFSLCPSPTLPLYHSPTLPLYHSPTLPLYASDRQETVTRQGRHPVIVTGPTSLLPAGPPPGRGHRGLYGALSHRAEPLHSETQTPCLTEPSEAGGRGGKGGGGFPATSAPTPRSTL